MTLFVDELKGRLEPVRLGDLDRLLEAVAALFQPVEDLARDTASGDPGWSRILDLNRAKAAELPWLAQFVGANYPRAVAEADATYEARVRPLILAKTVLERGTLAAAIRDVQETLTGTKQVYFIERQGGSAWRTTVSTLTTETPDPAATLRALLRHKPAGIVLTHTLVTGGTWATMLGTHTDWNDVNTPPTTWDAVLANPAL